MPFPATPPLGAHESIAGGYHKAVETAAGLGMAAVQIFTKNNNQWQGKPISDEEAARFRAALAEAGIDHPLAHDSYLINLASPNPELWRRSIGAFAEELLRAETLGIPYVVTHPGVCTGLSESQGLRRVAWALNRVHRMTRGLAARCLLETTAGQGTALGWRFEHFRQILDGVSEPERLGLCLDTCHVFAAGYPLRSADDYAETLGALDRAVGVERIRAFHLNDSLKGQGSRVDRHAHIGRGELGVEPFRHVLNDERFRHVPMYLETPKGTEAGEDLDAVNLRTLRGLMAP